MVVPVTWGTEVLVNSTTNGTQFWSAVTALDNGRHVVAWVDWGQNPGDISGQAIRAQVFNADGSAFGAEFLVNTTTSGNQNTPTIAALEGGRFVVAFKDDSAGSLSDDIRAQIYNADGTRAGSQMLVNGTTFSEQQDPTTTTLSDGRFLVAWADKSGLGGDASGYGIKAQVFSATGARLGSEFLINTTIEGWQANPQAAALTGGRIAVAWTDSSTTRSDNPAETSGAGIKVQLINADGSLFGAQMQVNSTTAKDQLNASITALAGGGFVVTWDDYSQSGGDTSLSSVRSQMFGADGTKLGAEILVNTKTVDGQWDSDVSALADGGFVVVWTDITGDGADSAIFAQIFNSAGAKSGAAFSVATSTAGTQGSPEVATLADGRFVVSWTDFSKTGLDISSSAIRSQIFDARLSGVTVEGSIAADDYRGSAFADRLSGATGDDLLMGYGGKDRLRGDDGKDTLSGGDGADVLTGGAGSDLLKGGKGADVFLFRGAGDLGSGKGADRIADFQSGTDRIDLSAVLQGGSFIGKAAFAATGQAQVRYDAALGVLSGDLDGDGGQDWTLTLLNTPTRLDAADFLF